MALFTISSSDCANNSWTDFGFITSSHGAIHAYIYKGAGGTDVGTADETSTVTIGNHQEAHRRNKWVNKKCLEDGGS